MANGLAGFKRFFGDFRSLSTLAAGTGAVAVPFAAALTSLSPPWPPNIITATGIINFLTLVVIYQIFKRSKQRTINRLVISGAVTLLVLCPAYLFSLSQLTLQARDSTQRYARGITCTEAANVVFGSRCPGEINIDDLAWARFDPTLVWTSHSVALVQWALAVVWSLSFIALTAMLGGFILYQTADDRKH